MNEKKNKKENPKSNTMDEISSIVLGAFSSYLKNEVYTGPPVTLDNVEDFLEKSLAHKILPMTVSSVLCGASVLPEEQIQRLKRFSMEQVAIQSQKTEAFLHVYKSLCHEGIKPLCLKGYFCRSLYPEDDVRISADEDLLVRLEDKKICHNVLVSFGFSCQEEKVDAQVTGYYHKESGCTIDLHTVFFPNNGELFRRFNEELGNEYYGITSYSLQGVWLYAPENNCHFLFLFLHAFKHFVTSGVGIRQIADLALFAKTEDLDWSFIFAKCALLRLEKLLQAFLWIAINYFGLDEKIVALPEICEDDCFDLLADIMNGGIYGYTDKNHLHSGGIVFERYEASLTKRKSSIFSVVFLKKRMMLSKYDYARKHPVLLPFAYVNRIIDYFKSEHNFMKISQIAQDRCKLMEKYGIF